MNKKGRATVSDWVIRKRRFFLSLERKQKSHCLSSDYAEKWLSLLKINEIDSSAD